MIIYYNREIDGEGLEYLIDSLPKNPCEEDQITMFFSSEGGDSDFVSVFKYVLEQYNVKIVAFNKVDSAALDILLATQVKRTILEDTIATYHFIEFEDITLNKNLEPRLSAKNIFEKDNTDTLDKNVRKSLGIFEEEHEKLLLEGEEYYFNTQELRKAIKNSKKFF